MTIKLIGQDAFPSFIGLTSDVGAGYISGSLGAKALIGKTIYITDTPAWYIILDASASAVSVEEFKFPTAVT